jgi:hypothetical protein
MSNNSNTNTNNNNSNSNKSIWTSISDFFKNIFNSSTTFIKNNSPDSKKLKQAINADSLRKKYIIQFILFFIISIILYIYNPFGLFTTYVGPTLFIILFLGLFLITMIVFYDYLFKHPNAENIPKDLSQNVFFILFAFLVSAGMIILLLWCLGLFSSSINSSNDLSQIINFIFNFLLLFVMLSIVYKILSLSAIGKYPLTRVILYSIFYIPCLFVSLIEFILDEYHKTTKAIVILLVIEVILVILYFIIPKIIGTLYLQGGKQLINKPLALDSENDIATYQTLNNSDAFNYHYAMSFWFNIDAMSPSTNSNYSYYTNILNYGDNPSIKYNALTNTLLITVKASDKNLISIVNLTHTLESKIPDAEEEEILNIQKEIKQTINKINTIPLQTELDNKGQRIIYIKKNVLLQKWNNLIINYSGGTLDIFLNGELVKSAINVVSYITYDKLTIGAKNGLSGGISNLIYYSEPLDMIKIKKLYNKMKDKNPPITSDNDKTIV